MKKHSQFNSPDNHSPDTSGILSASTFICFGCGSAALRLLRLFAAIPLAPTFLTVWVPGGQAQSNSVKPMLPVKPAGKSYANTLQLTTCKTTDASRNQTPSN
jgi:hypothetical protein